VTLTATDIRRAFDALSTELGANDRRAQIAITGGAALVLLFDARETTKDVDAYFVQPDPPIIRAAAAKVARDLALPEDWLNDAAKGYFVAISEGPTVYESTSLIVRAVAIEQLLAMKLAAWRDAIDRGDARLLIAELPGTREEIWSNVRQFVPVNYADKASYAFDDLWDSVHGTA